MQQSDSGLNDEHALELLFCGDLILDAPDPDYWLSGIAPAIQAADLAIGHLEVPHSNTQFELKGDVPAPGAPPAYLKALQQAGFTALSMAGNHIADCGPQGIADTCALLDELDIAHCGAGANLDAARKASILSCKGRKLGLLSYNCVGPEISWAAANQAGSAYLKLLAEDGGPVTPKKSALVLCDETLEVLNEDISQLKEQVDLVLVALHKGITHRPAELAPYERPLAQAAIDAGADIVIGHHAHIVQGIEFYKGKPIYHGLGNGCVVTRALSPGQDHPERAAWVQKRKALFGFEPDPAFELAPFHPEAVNAMLGTVRWHADGRLEAGMIPVIVEAPGRPVLATGKTAQAVTDYIRQIGPKAGLPTLQMRLLDQRVLFSD